MRSFCHLAGVVCECRYTSTSEGMWHCGNLCKGGHHWARASEFNSWKSGTSGNSRDGVSCWRKHCYPFWSWAVEVCVLWMRNGGVQPSHGNWSSWKTNGEVLSLSVVPRPHRVYTCRSVGRWHLVKKHSCLCCMACLGPSWGNCPDKTSMFWQHVKLRRLVSIHVSFDLRNIKNGFSFTTKTYNTWKETSLFGYIQQQSFKI